MDLMPEFEIKKGFCLNRDDIDFAGEYGEQMSVIFSDATTKPITGLVYEEDENGRILSYCYYVDGLLDGEAVYLHENGNIKMVANFVRGSLFGKKMIWYENGSLKFESESKYGVELFRREWDLQGILVREKSHPTEFELKMLKKYEGIG